MDVSIIIPVLNEEESIPELYPHVSEVMKKTGKDYEIIFVDDGSTDKSFDILKGINKKDNTVRIIKFRRNFGQTAAISAGIKHSKGEVIVTLDADLQNDPSDIPKLLDKMNDGFDVVCGWRKDRKDPLVSKKIPSKISNWLARKLTKVEIHDFGCTLRVYKKESLRDIELYGEMHRYIPALIASEGFRITEVPVAHHERAHGKSKYGTSRLLRGFLSLTSVKFWVKYSKNPIQFFGSIGLIQMLLGVAIGAYLSMRRFLFKESLSDRPLLFLSVMLIIVGIQFITLGFLGEMIARSYFDSTEDAYSIEERLG